MEYQKFSQFAFLDYLYDTTFERKITKIILHSLWRNPKNVWWGEKSVKGLNEYYKKQGRSFGFHIAIHDKKIWLCKSLDEVPDQSGGKLVNKGSIAIEIDQVINGRKASKESWENYLWLTQKLMEKFNLSPDKIFLHGDFYTKEQKKLWEISCPGFTIEHFLDSLNATDLNGYDEQEYLEDFNGNFNEERY